MAAIPDPSLFQESYICHPISETEKSDLQTGDRIIMPDSALERIMLIEDVEFPMLFEIKNPTSGRVSHCGVFEFTAVEGMVFMPNWMVRNLKLREGDNVEIKKVNLPKGRYVKLRPHVMDFTAILDCDITRWKYVLEEKLKNFSCLSAGDTIMIKYFCQEFYIDVLETEPSSSVSIIDADCEVDFVPPIPSNERVLEISQLLASTKI